MASPAFCLLVAISVLGTCTDRIRGFSGDVSGSGSAVMPTEPPIAIPTCVADDECMSSDGERLFCRTIPPCTCFVGGPQEPDGAPLPSEVPLPPTGCPVFQPPLRGAFVCYLNSTLPLMFCSVYCDYRFEFRSTPHNPYSCGPSTGFQWRDPTNQTHSALPECTAHKHPSTPLHGIANYLPAPCYGLTNQSILNILDWFRETLRRLGHFSTKENIFMQCPSFEGTSYFYDDISPREK